MNNAILILFGLAAGIMSGLLGIGGGIFIIPVLVFLLGFSQQTAQGTTLAMMVPPIGLLAAWAYYKAGFVDIKVAGLMCIGFFIGGFFGAKLATALSGVTLSRIFGVAMLVVSIKMILAK
jgi:uncharacterized membrane protein YfcA